MIYLCVSLKCTCSSRACMRKIETGHHGWVAGLACGAGLYTCQREPGRPWYTCAYISGHCFVDTNRVGPTRQYAWHDATLQAVQNVLEAWPLVYNMVSRHARRPPGTGQCIMQWNSILLRPHVMDCMGGEPNEFDLRWTLQHMWVKVDIWAFKTSPKPYLATCISISIYMC